MSGATLHTHVAQRKAYMSTTTLPPVRSSSRLPCHCSYHCGFGNDPASKQDLACARVRSAQHSPSPARTQCPIPAAPPRRFIREYPGTDRVRGNVHVATKLAAYPWRVLPGNMVAACKGSLRRLGAEQVSIGQLHWSTANYQPLQVRAAGRRSRGRERAAGGTCWRTAAMVVALYA